MTGVLWFASLAAQREKSSSRGFRGAATRGSHKKWPENQKARKRFRHRLKDVQYRTKLWQAYLAAKNEAANQKGEVPDWADTPEPKKSQPATILTQEDNQPKKAQGKKPSAKKACAPKAKSPAKTKQAPKKIAGKTRKTRFDVSLG